MAKIKLSGSRKASARRDNRAVIPCLVLVLLGTAMIAYLFYVILKGDS